VVDRSSSPTDRRTAEWTVSGRTTRLRYEHAGDGIIWANSDGSFELINCSLSPLEYRFYLTYFDQIDIPLIPPDIFHFGERDWEYLEDIDFLTHTMIGAPEAYNLEPVQEVIPDFFSAPIWALEERAQKEPGVWSFSSKYREYLADRELDTGALEINLMDLLPVPSPENSFADVMEYRKRYRDELLSLRSSMHNLYQRLLVEPDLPRSWPSLCGEIESALTQVKQSMKGVGIGSLQISLKTELDLRTITTGAAAFSYFSAHHVPLPLSLPLASVAAMLSIRPKKADTKLLVKGCPVDFAYIAGFDRYL